MVLPGPGSPVQSANQRAVRSGSVMLAHTSSIGARNVRVRTRSRPASVCSSRPVGVGGVVVMRFAPRRRMRCPPAARRSRRVRWTSVSSASRRAPQPVAERRQPGVELGQRRDVEPVDPLAPVGGSSTTSPASRSTRRCRLTAGRLIGNRSAIAPAVIGPPRSSIEDLPPHRVRDRPDHRVHGRKRNRSVTHLLDFHREIAHLRAQSREENAAGWGYRSSRTRAEPMPPPAHIDTQPNVLRRGGAAR